MNFQNLILGGLLGADLRGLAEDAANQLLAEQLGKFFERQNAKVARKVKKTGEAAIPEALLHLWASLLKSGTLADLVRDGQREKILQALSGKITADTPKTEIVRLVAAEVVRLTF